MARKIATTTRKARRTGKAKKAKSLGTRAIRARGTYLSKLKKLGYHAAICVEAVDVEKRAALHVGLISGQGVNIHGSLEC